jgi:hypothetical protein
LKVESQRLWTRQRWKVKKQNFDADSERDAPHDEAREVPDHQHHRRPRPWGVDDGRAVLDGLQRLFGNRVRISGDGGSGRPRVIDVFTNPGFTQTTRRPVCRNL